MRRAHEEALRQGEIASKGKWIGDPLGGVKAPQALILPDPTTRFANSAARTEALSAGHPMKEWLCFMARLARAQHVVAMILGPSPSLDKSRWSRRCAHACHLFLQMGIVATRLGAKLSQCCSKDSTTGTYERPHARSWRACARARAMKWRPWPTAFSAKA